MKALTLLFLSLIFATTTGCAGSKWWKGIGAGRTAGVDDLPAGSMPASRIGQVTPYQYRSYESWSTFSSKEKGEWVWVEIYQNLDGTVTRRVVKQPYSYKYGYRYERIWIAPTK